MLREDYPYVGQRPTDLIISRPEQQKAEKCSHETKRQLHLCLCGRRVIRVLLKLDDEAGFDAVARNRFVAVLLSSTHLITHCPSITNHMYGQQTTAKGRCPDSILRDNEGSDRSKKNLGKDNSVVDVKFKHPLLPGNLSFPSADGRPDVKYCAYSSPASTDNGTATRVSDLLKLTLRAQTEPDIKAKPTFAKVPALLMRKEVEEDVGNLE
ncbi:hypothetical protein P7K49_028567 [Saguinus oedipus]|uniref:Uncharacterized protein n=1 Tax=Saguinus oedipus TaxID=9490 RepID=A0ABQ9U4P5_SAGOE|nr:hypothetical protein P7K49_028567 [Saguinus oedipus]